MQVVHQVSKLRQWAQGGDQCPRAALQGFRIRRLQRELVGHGAVARVDGQFLHRLQIQGGRGGKLCRARLQARHDGAHVVARLFGRERNVQAATVHRGVFAIVTRKGRDAGDGIIARQFFGQLRLHPPHGGKRHARRCLRVAEQHAGVLQGEKPFRHHQIQQHGEHQRGDGNGQRPALPRQHPIERARVGGDGAFKQPPDGAMKCRLFVFRRVAQQAGAHHRRERKRNRRRKQNRDRQRDGKFAKQPPGNVAHEQQRNQHGDQREGQRNDGETNLPRAFERCLHRRLTRLGVAGDVFNHHDGIIDDKASGDGQRHQREVVDGIVQQIHHRKGADE